MITAMAVATFDPAGIAARKTVVAVKIIQTEGMHDTAILTLYGMSTDAPELQSGIPVQVDYGWANVDMETFYGYVDHIETHYDRSVPDRATMEDVVCLGVSYTLKDPFVGAWSQVQASSLVKQIANKYFLSTAVEDDDTVWPQLSSPGGSAWEFLTQLSNLTGYSLACNKSMVRFTSVDLAMREYWQTMPIFKTRSTASTYIQQSISCFQALTGESLNLVGHTKAIRQISGMDLTSGRIVSATNNGNATMALGQRTVNPFFGQQISDVVVSNLGHAQAVLSGLSECNRFAYQATATLSGLTAVKQGVPVVLTGIDSNSDGTWWVEEVIHRIVSEGYSMDVTLGRDSLGDTGLRATQGTSVAFTPQNPFAYVIANAPPTRIVNQRWRSAYQSNVDLC
jgi:phage protein D